MSQYQPGGTATVLCNNWTSCLITNGEDPLGLGRWSFITLRGKGTKKVTIITAYNASLTYGDRTNNRQQRVLSHLHIAHKQHISANPRRQFILDLQAWIKELIHQEHEIILAIDANDSYDPDTSTNEHPLTYVKVVPCMYEQQYGQNHRYHEAACNRKTSGPKN